MNQLEYLPGIAGQSVQLDGPSAFVGIAEEMRSREWDYDLGYRDLVTATRPARTVDVTFHADYETADYLRRVADADVMARTPGTFVAQNEWKQRGYILASDVDDIHYGRLSTGLKIALLDGAWWRRVVRSFMPSGSGGGDTYLDYPHDFPYDYQAASSTADVTPSVLTPSDVYLVVFGPAVNPYIIVGGNRYQVNVSVPAGGYLVADGREKTIMLTLADGTVQNVFSSGVRGSGAGGGSYIFEKVPAGTSEVTYDGSFGFDLGWYEEEGEPPWSQS